MRLSRRAGTLAAFLAFACSSGSGSPPGGGNFGGEWNAFCEADAERDQSCGSTPNPDACLQQRSCMEQSWRTQALPPVFDCLTSRACGQSDDGCFEQGGQAVARTPAIDAYYAACTSFHGQCGGSDDLCGGSAALLSDASLNQLASCMKQPCDQAEACVESIVDTIDCW